KHRRQTGDAGRVSSTVAAVYDVGSHHLAHKLAREKVELVRRLVATKKPETIPPIAVPDGPEPFSRHLQRFIPRRPHQTAVAPHERKRKTLPRPRQGGIQLLAVHGCGEGHHRFPPSSDLPCAFPRQNCPQGQRHHVIISYVYSVRPWRHGSFPPRLASSGGIPADGRRGALPAPARWK